MEPLQETSQNPLHVDNPSPNSKTSSSSSIEVDVNLKDKPKDKLTMNFGQGVDMNEYLTRPTETETKRAQSSTETNPDVKQVITTSLTQLSSEDPSKYSQEIDQASFDTLAEGTIWVIDIIITWMIAKFALDPNVNSTPYKIQEQKIQRLKVILGKIFAQMKTRFPLPWLFFAMLVACYVPSFIKAKEVRGENLKLREAKKKEAEKNKIDKPTLKQKIHHNIQKGNTQKTEYVEVVLPEEEESEQDIIIKEQEEVKVPEVKTIRIDRKSFMKAEGNPRPNNKNTKKKNLPSSDQLIPVVPGKKGRGGNTKN